MKKLLIKSNGWSEQSECIYDYLDRVAAHLNIQDLDTEPSECEQCIKVWADTIPNAKLLYKELSEEYSSMHLNNLMIKIYTSEVYL